MSNAETLTPRRTGTIHLPGAKPTPPQPAPIPMPPRDKFKIETTADVSKELAPEHRKEPIPRECHKLPAKIKEHFDAVAKMLIERTREIPAKPKDTRQLRLMRAVIEAAPGYTPGAIGAALRAYALGATDEERTAVEELRQAVGGVVLNMKLARFEAAVASAIAVLEQRRAEPKQNAETPSDAENPEATKLTVV